MKTVKGAGENAPTPPPQRSHEPERCMPITVGKDPDYFTYVPIFGTVLARGHDPESPEHRF